MVARHRAVRFLHCARCVQSRPPSKSAADNARLQVGITPEGELEVWCLRHDMLVARFAEVPHIEACSCSMCAAPITRADA